DRAVADMGGGAQDRPVRHPPDRRGRVSVRPGAGVRAPAGAAPGERRDRACAPARALGQADAGLRTLRRSHLAVDRGRRAHQRDRGEGVKGNDEMSKHRITRRKFAGARAGAAAGLTPIVARAQQHYPTRPVRFVLPFAPAGIADITARIAAEKLGDKLGQRFVVENQPGPGGIAAARAVLSQPTDGYTIGLVTNGTSISAAIYNALPFDPVKDFATVSAIGYFDLVFASNMDSEFKTMADFINVARAQPGKLNVGTINVGGTQNLAAELLKSSAGLNVQIIPYRGTPDVIVAVLRNDVQLMV